MDKTIDKDQTLQDKEPATSTKLIASGISIGALGAGAALLIGTVCPICVVATPSLIGGGIVMKLIDKHKKDKE